MPSLPLTLKVLSDPTRLRILALLAREELSVGELARAMAMSQSRVSNHLKVLRDAGMLEERREGASVLVRRAADHGLTDQLWTAIEPRTADLEERAADQERLQKVLEERRQKSREFFQRVAAEWDVIGSDFVRGTGRFQALATLVPAQLVVADLGCGTGYMARTLVRFVERVICVDHSRAMLDRARESLAESQGRVEFREGELDHLPLAAGEVDCVFASMVMHHVPDLQAALREILRVLKPGGKMVITDLLPHREHWMAEDMADLRLGIDPAEAVRRARKAGFAAAHSEALEDLYAVEAPGGRRVELPLFLLVGSAPVDHNGTHWTPTSEKQEMIS